MIQGRRAFFGYTTDPTGCSWWFARLPVPELSAADLASITTNEWKRRTAAFFAEDTTPAAAIIAATGENIVGSNAYDVPSTPVWFTPSIVLVGDAAHAASPAAGQGASMALEDSVTLARCLRDLADPVRAFGCYEALRRERVERLVEISAEQGASQTSATDVDQRPRSRAWLYDHHINWDQKVSFTPPKDSADGLA